MVHYSWIFFRIDVSNAKEHFKCVMLNNLSEEEIEQTKQEKEMEDEATAERQ